MKKKIPQQSLFSDEDRKLLIEARNTAMRIAYEEGCVSADEVREKFSGVEQLHRNAMGSLFKTKDFIWNGVKKSFTKSRKGGLISVYLLSDEARTLIATDYQRKAGMA